MVRFTRRRRVAALAAVAVVVVVLGAVAVASFASQHLTHPLARHPGTPPHQVRQTAMHTPMGTPSSHDSDAASLQLAAPYVTPGSPLRAMASGFLGGEPLAVTINDLHGDVYEHLRVQADKGGRLSETSLSLPVRLGAGTYLMTVVGGASHRRASATFQMDNIPPTVMLDAYTAIPGQVIGFAGNGFIPGEMVSVYLGASSAPLFRTTVTSRGVVSGQLTVPKIPAGTYTLTLLGKTSRMQTSVGFNVQRFTPWVVLDRYTLAPGQREGFIAHGFAPGEQVFVYLNLLHGTPVLRVRADTAGQVVMQDTWLPGGASGNNVLTFVGQWSKATITVDFTILATA